MTSYFEELADELTPALVGRSRGVGGADRWFRQQTVSPVKVAVVRRPTSTTVTLASTKKAEEKLDCCAPPKRSALVPAALKTTPTRTVKVAVVQAAPTKQPTGASPIIVDFLKPTGPAVAWVLDKQPRKTFPAPTFLENPETVFPPIAGDLIRPPAELPHVVLLPRKLTEDAPLAEQPRGAEIAGTATTGGQAVDSVAARGFGKARGVAAVGEVSAGSGSANGCDRRSQSGSGAADADSGARCPGAVRALSLPEPFEFRSTQLPAPPEEK